MQNHTTHEGRVGKEFASQLEVSVLSVHRAASRICDGELHRGDGFTDSRVHAVSGDGVTRLSIQQPTDHEAQHDSGLALRLEEMGLLSWRAVL